MVGFFQIQGIFHYFGAVKAEILHIYSLTGQMLKQLSPSVSVTNVRYPPLVTSFRGIIVKYIFKLRGPNLCQGI